MLIAVLVALHFASPCLRKHSIRSRIQQWVEIEASILSLDGRCLDVHP